MKQYNSVFILFLTGFLSIILSCSSFRKNDPSTTTQPDLNIERADSEAVVKDPETISDLIVVRDIFNRETYSLKKISNQMPVFIEITSSWCPACKDMEKTTAKLYEYFKGRIFFIRLFRAGDAVLDETSTVNAMEIVSSPEKIAIEYSEVLPRVIILDRSGKEVVADINGVYPVIYYYGVLSELL